MDEDSSVEYLQKLFADIKRKEDKFRPARTAFILALIDARFKKHWSQAQLAEQSGLQQSVISRIEAGNGNPSLNTLLKIARALEVNLVLE